MEIVSVYNDKGGVGKSSTVLELGVALATSGKRVLLIDNDPQGSLSVSCIKKINEVNNGMDDVYRGDISFIDAITDTFVENLFIIPAGRSLKNEYFRKDDRIIDRVEEMVSTFRNNETFLELFDVVMIDNPPVQDGTALYCTIHANRIIIPVVPDDVCFDGLVRTYQFLEKQCPDFMEKKIIIVPTLYKNRSLHKKYLAAIKKGYDKKNDNTMVTEAVISDRSEVPESISMKQILFISHAASESANQYKRICLDVFPWLEKNEFLVALSTAAENKKRAARDKFKKMIEERKKLKEAIKIETEAVHA